MNIWIINQNAYTPELAGGTRHYELARALNAKGHNVSIIASSFFHKSKVETKLQAGEKWKIEFINNVRYVWIKTPSYNGNIRRIINMFSFKKSVQKHFPEFNLPIPDIIIGSSPHLLSALTGLQIAKRFKVPFLLEIRDIWPETIVQLGGHSPKHPFIQYLYWVEKKLYRNADGIISLLPLAIDYFVSKGFDRNKILWLPNGVDFDGFEYKLPPLNPVFEFVYAGAHGLANAIDSMLEAIAISNVTTGTEKVRFRFVGDGPLKPKLKEKAKMLGLTNVIFDDPVPKGKIFEVLNQANAFFFTLKDSPLYKYGISYNKMFDFMAVGRPIVVGSGCDYNPIEEAKCGVVTLPENPQAMADGILQILNASESEWIKMGENGRNYCLENHSFKNLANKLENFIYNVKK